MLVHATMALSRSLAKVKEFRTEKSASGERAYSFGNQPRACREQHPPFVIKRVVGVSRSAIVLKDVILIANTLRTEKRRNPYPVKTHASFVHQACGDYCSLELVFGRESLRSRKRDETMRKFAGTGEGRLRALNKYTRSQPLCRRVADDAGPRPRRRLKQRTMAR